MFSAGYLQLNSCRGFPYTYLPINSLIFSLGFQGSWLFENTELHFEVKIPLSEDEGPDRSQG